jgi:hypothetical protein
VQSQLPDTNIKPNVDETEEMAPMIEKQNAAVSTIYRIPWVID